jgi:undecaprenyl-diphosphatase
MDRDKTDRTDIDMDWQAIIDLDKELLLWFNGSQSLYLDSLVRTLTNGWTWLPLYLSLCFVVIKNNDTVQKILFVIACAGLCILIAGTVDDEIVKPTVARWRPTHDPQIGMLVDIVDGYRGGLYGFFSAHASNTFSLTIFFWWLMRSRLLTTAMVLWSLTNCWTRLYLGVHYPGDILVGLCWGFISGSLVFLFYHRVTRNQKRKYMPGDMNIPVGVLVFTLVFALIKSSFA